MRLSATFTSCVPRSNSWTYRHSLLQFLYLHPRSYAYSTSSGNYLVKVRFVPAPHTGRIAILTLASPTNKNAISKQLLHELGGIIYTLRQQWDYPSGPNGKSIFEKGYLKQNSSKTTDVSLSSTGNEEAEQEGSPGTQDDSASDTAQSNKPLIGFPLTPQDSSTATRVLILASEVDGVFCAGADLKERRDMNLEETQNFLFKLRGLLGRLATLPIPTISAISGFALGGGLELALASTFRVLDSTAVVGLPETRLGIIPGAGGIMRLRSLVGVAKANEIILTGRRIGAKEAYELGICERFVEDNELDNTDQDEQTRSVALQAALKMAKEICEGAPVAITAALKGVGTGVGVSRARWENMLYDLVVKTRDRDEALQAFQEKRKPSFTGR